MILIKFIFDTLFSSLSFYTLGQFLFCFRKTEKLGLRFVAYAAAPWFGYKGNEIKKMCVMCQHNLNCKKCKYWTCSNYEKCKKGK